MDERFARTALIPGWNQRRLAEANVIILGMGAIGNEVGRILAMAGVGRLLLCDHDRVEITNLSRCCLFRDADVGRLKVDAAADALNDLAPSTLVQTRAQTHIHGVGLAELREADLILSCLDSHNARLELAGRCGMLGVGWLDAGTHAWGGEIRPYLDPDGPCYGCSLSVTQRAKADIPVSCAQPPEHQPEAASIPVSALIASWMGLLAVRYLLSLERPTATLRIDAASTKLTTVQICKDPSCLLHERMGLTRVLDVSANDSVAVLLNALSTHARPLAWAPFQTQRQCFQCGYTETIRGLPQGAPCSICGGWRLPDTTLELVDAPHEALLSELGVAPREILAVRMAYGLDWVELVS